MSDEAWFNQYFGEATSAPSPSDAPGLDDVSKLALPTPGVNPSSPSADDAGGQAAVPTFMPVDHFTRLSFPAPEVLLGTNEHAVLFRGCFGLIWGDRGATKTSVAVDQAGHMAAGLPWCELPVPRPIRSLLIENEGSPGRFQRRLMQKRETWTADPAWFDNVHVQGGEGLWGYFNFRHQSHRQALRAYCNAQGIDVVIANPAFGLGAPGSGRPDETQRFVDEFLRDVGLWDDLAIVLLHHSGKSGNVSGDWGRQPDPEIELQRDGDKPRTRIIWHKVWESDEAAERPKRQLLDWVPQHKGFTLSDADLSGHVPDDEYLARIDAFLHAHPGANTKSVRSGVKGDGTRIVGLLREGADQGRYLMQEGAHGAKCWRLAGESPA